MYSPVKWNSRSFRLYQTDLWGTLSFSGKITKVIKHLAYTYERYQKRKAKTKFSGSTGILRFDNNSRKLKQFKRRSLVSQTSVDLRKFKKFYRNLTVKQFKTLLKKFSSSSQPVNNLLVFLEKRLDTILFRSGFFPSLSSATHFIRYGHIKVNSSMINVSAYQIKKHDLLEISNKSFLSLTNTSRWIFSNRFNKSGGRINFQPPVYLELDFIHFSISLIADIDLNNIFYPFSFPSLQLFFNKRIY